MVRLDDKVICPFCFEEPAVTGDTFLTMMENTTLCHFPVGTVSQLHDGSPTSHVVFVPFWTGSFPIVG
jgi:hypothetical protein